MMVTFRSRAMSISASTAFVGALLWAAAHTTIELPAVNIFVPEPQPIDMRHEALPQPVDPVRRQVEPQPKAEDDVYVERAETTITDPPVAIEVGPPSASTLVNPTWIRKPTIDDLLGFYPSSAMDRGIAGHVMLDCIVAANGRLTCNVAAESPTGMGFGTAAKRASKLFQIAPQMQDGKPTEGGRISVAIAFKPPSD